MKPGTIIQSKFYFNLYTTDAASSRFLERKRIKTGDTLIVLDSRPFFLRDFNGGKFFNNYHSGKRFQCEFILDAASMLSSRNTGYYNHRSIKDIPKHYTMLSNKIFADLKRDGFLDGFRIFNVETGGISWISKYDLSMLTSKKR